MSKESTKARKKELELRQQEAETKKAELEARSAELSLSVQEFDYKSTHEQSGEITGTFYFHDVVTDSACSYLASRVRRFSNLNPGAPITVVINTPGGSVLAGLGLFDELRAVAERGNPLTTQVRGYAASMGAVLLQAGDTRLVGPESLVMLHEIASATGGKLHEMENDVETTKKLNSRAFEIIARRTDGKYTAAKLYARVKAKDWWVSADEAVKNGFADAIG